MKAKKEIESSHGFLLPLAYVWHSYYHPHFFLPCIVLFCLTLWVLFISDRVSSSMVSNWKVSALQSMFSQFDSKFLLSSPGVWNFAINSLFIVKKYQLSSCCGVTPFFQLLTPHHFFSEKNFCWEVKPAVNRFSFPNRAWEASQTHIPPSQESENCWTQPHSSDSLKIKIATCNSSQFRWPWRRVGPQ